MRSLNTAQNIGYIIPSEEIELFLKDVSDGHFDGKPALVDEYQTLDNPALRSYLKSMKSLLAMQDRTTGAARKRACGPRGETAD